MTSGIRPSSRVRIAIPRSSPRALHCLDSVPVLEADRSVSDRIDAGADHPVVVMFDLWHLGTQWVDRFTGDELVLV